MTSWPLAVSPITDEEMKDKNGGQIWAMNEFLGEGRNILRLMNNEWEP